MPTRDPVGKSRGHRAFSPHAGFHSGCET